MQYPCFLCLSNINKIKTRSSNMKTNLHTILTCASHGRVANWWKCQSLQKVIHSQEWMISTDATWHRISGVGTSHDQYLKYLGEISVFKIGLSWKELLFYPVVSTVRYRTCSHLSGIKSKLSFINKTLSNAYENQKHSHKVINLPSPSDC